MPFSFSCSSWLTRFPSHFLIKRPHISVNSYIFSSRLFSSIRTPIGPRSPDNIYRRPDVDEVKEVLDESDELIWSDAQAPEPALDEYSHVINPYHALGYLILALTTTVGGGYLLAAKFSNPDNNPVIPQIFPYQNLQTERGGRSHSNSTATTNNQ